MATDSNSDPLIRKKQDRWLPTVPAHVIESYEKGFNRSLESTDEVMAATYRLLTDERMREPWRKLGRACATSSAAFKGPEDQWGDSFLWSAHTRYQQAINPDPWDMLTRAEQLEWYSKLEKIICQLEGLFQASPTGSGRIGLFIENETAHEFVEHLGFKVVDPENYVDEQGGGRWVEPPPNEIVKGRVVNAKFVMRQTLVEGLKSYSRRMQEMFPPEEWQPLKKPRDASAPRRRFILTLTEDQIQFYGQPMRELVATTAEVMFEDPAITERLVRRYTNVD